MPAASCLIHGPFDEEMIRLTSESMRQEVGGQATVAFAFVTSDWIPALEEFCDLIRLHGHVPQVFGCTAAGLTSDQNETEGMPGASILFLNLPGLRVHPIELNSSETKCDVSPASWHRRVSLSPAEIRAWLLLLNPFALKVEPWLHSWNQAWPGIPGLGGLASSIHGQQGIHVFSNGRVMEGGGLAIALSGPFTLRYAISQGCHPIGQPLTITRAQEHVVLQLGAQTPFAALNEIIAAMSEEERERARGNIFVGLAADEYRDELSTGDFLVRNIAAADPQSGAIVIGAWPRPGQTLQFQLRDRTTAEKDYRRVLETLQPHGTPLASLLFTCTGRGQRFFGQPGHDARLLGQILGPHPSAGFFCNGEIGPVRGHTHIHAYTTTLAAFYPATASGH